MSIYPTLSKKLFAKRRAALAKRVALQGGGVVLLQSGMEIMRNRDSDYPFRSDSYFYYLTGFPEPEACLAIQVQADGTNEAILFCRDRDPEREIWDGFRFGPAQAKRRFGFDQVHCIDDMHVELEGLLANQPAVFIRLGQDADLEQGVAQVMEGLRAKVRQGIAAPHAIIDITHELDEMRLTKQSQELEIMRKAASISALAHCNAMRATAPGMYEYQVEAELLYTFRQHGSEFPAYGSIVASGANACVLHYRANNALLQNGDLLLIDAGCEFDSYASDITRTFPVNGVFSKAQQAVYEIVLEAQYAAIKATRSGVRFNAPHDAAVDVLAQGMIDLGLLQGSLSEVVESKAYSKFYMHRTSHWLGMDVHDCGSYRDPQAPAKPEKGQDVSRHLRAGMVLTIEPGMYIRAAKDVPEAFHNIGIRIEDDAIVTARGCEVYSHEVPKTVNEIQKLMKSRK